MPKMKISEHKKKEVEYMYQIKSIDQSLQILNEQNPTNIIENKTINIESNIELASNKFEQYTKFFDATYETRALAASQLKEHEDYEDYEDYEKMYNEMYAHLIDNKKQTVEEKAVGILTTIESMNNNTKSIPKHLKAVESINDIVTAYSKFADLSDYVINKEHMTAEEYNKIVSSNSVKEDINKNKKIVKSMPIPFEKKKFMHANFFMKIGHFIGLSLRNQYYKNLDDEVIKALNNDEVYRVLEAQQNGYFLGKKLNVLTLGKLYDNLTRNPSKLINELVIRDILLSYENLALVVLSPEGKELILNENPDNNPYAKKLYIDLLTKENFLFASKNVWLRSVQDKQKFLKENNPLFYYDKMLAICEKNELLGVKKTLEGFLQEKEILNSISKNKLIDKMILKLDILLGNSIELEHIISDLPKVAQKLYYTIKEINFSNEDKKILESSYQFEYEIVEKRMPEAIIKYLGVDIEYRDNLKNISGKTAENLLIETLENILITKKDLNLFLNQQKLSDLSITRRYTDSIRGDIGRPSIVTLKTVQQLRDSGELNDFANDLMLQNINTKDVEKSTSSQLDDIITSNSKTKKLKI